MIIRNHDRLIRAGKTYGLTPWMSAVVAYLPLGIVTLFTLGLVLTPTRHATIWMLEESRPVEILTFVVFMVAVVASWNLAWHAHRRGDSMLVRVFCSFFCVALFFVGMEEIAWGQYIFLFDSPDIFQSANQQREVTLHNLPGLHGHNVFLRFAFGLGGLLGLAAAAAPSLQRISTPVPLVPGLVVILLLAMIDMACNYWPIWKPLDLLTWRLSEVVELVIAITALTYAILNARRL